MQEIEHRISKMPKNILTQRLVSTTNTTVAIAKRRKACSTLAGAEPSGSFSPVPPVPLLLGHQEVSHY